LARLPRPQLALTAPELAELPGEIDQALTEQRVATARELLTGLSSGALAVTAVGAIVLTASGDAWARSLAGVLVALVLLRSRLFAARQPVFVGIAAAVVALIGLAATTIPDATQRELVVTALVSAVVAIGALVVGVTAGRWTASPRQRRLVDVLETLLLVSVAPVVLGVWRVYSTLFHLNH
jgi:hypothetical protein